MAVVKESTIVAGLPERFARQALCDDAERGRCFPRARDVMGCLRRAFLSRGEKRIGDEHAWSCAEWKWGFYRDPAIAVVRDNHLVSDNRVELSAWADLIIAMQGEPIVVHFLPCAKLPDAPRKVDVIEIISAIWLTSSYAGILFYCSGRSAKTFFVNPDRREYTTLIHSVIERLALLAAHIRTGECPAGETGPDCKQCVYAAECPAGCDAKQTSGHHGNNEPLSAPPI